MDGTQVVDVLVLCLSLTTYFVQNGQVLTSQDTPVGIGAMLPHCIFQESLSGVVQLLFSAAAVVSCATELMTVSMAFNGADVTVRLRTQLLSAARLSSAAVAGRQHDPAVGLAWAWDVAVGYEGVMPNERADHALCRALACALAACCSTSYAPAVSGSPYIIVPHHVIPFWDPVIQFFLICMQ